MLEHTAIAKKFYKSARWRKCRESYIQSVFGMCEHCDKPGYIVDHIVEINIENINDVSITLNHENLQYLCTPCHNKKTFGKAEVTRDDVMFDEHGNLVMKKTPYPPINKRKLEALGTEGGDSKNTQDKFEWGCTHEKEVIANERKRDFQTDRKT